MALLQVTTGTTIGRSTSVFAHSDSELINLSKNNVRASKSLPDFKEQRIVTLNVGGQIFKTYVGTLLKIKSSRLGSIARSSLNSNHQEYFFDRNPEVFASILDYCRFNRLHLPKHICSVYIRNELEFWDISEKDISECCQRFFFNSIDEVRVNENLALEFASLRPKHTRIPQTRRDKIYHMIHYPETSLFAKIWAVIYYILVVVTVFNIFLSTVPECRVPVDGALLPPYYTEDHDHGNHSSESSGSSGNSSSSSSPQSAVLSISDFLQKQLESNSKVRILVTTEVTPAIQYIDLFCLFYFTVEFVVRVSTVPSLWHMFKKFFTFCDLMYLIPVWVLYIVQWVDEKFWRQPEHIVVFLLLECCIAFRVVALFRVANHYRGLRVLVLSLRASMGELFLLFVFIIFGMIVFSSLIYCAEIFVAGHFENMFYGLWWSLITMTTVGYGDTVPKSGFGYLVACICAMTGIILIGMIVPIITNNFYKYYEFRTSVNTPESVPCKVFPAPNESPDPCLYINTNDTAH